jgi:predicted RNA-binding protein with RPS1 domain
MTKKGLESFLKVPVLLMQMLCLWHDNITVGKTKTAIYKSLVHHQIQMYVRKRTTKQQVSNSCGNDQALICGDNKCFCKEFCTLLTKVGKLAFKTLVNENHVNELIFDHDITEIYDLCEDDIETCLNIGILSQEKLLGKITELKKYYSFVHKSNQEFFASLYLVNQVPLCNIPDVLNNFVCKLDKMLKLENIITFVSGLNPAMGREMATMLLQAAEKDPRIQEHRQIAWWSPYHELVLNVQNVILAVITESGQNQPQQKVQLKDIFVTDENVAKVLLSWVNINTFKLVSLNMRGDSDMYGDIDNYLDTAAVLVRVTDATILQKVVLLNCKIGHHIN